MAGGMTAAFAQNVLALLTNSTGADPLPSTELYVHLYNVSLTDTVDILTTGRTGSTAGAANYAPAQLSNTTAFWTNASSTSPSRVENRVILSFTTDASTGWGQISGFTITDGASTNSSPLWWGDITPPQLVSAGNIVQFSTGDLVIVLGGGTAT